MGNRALILVDIQKAFHDPKWGERNNPDAEKNAGKILKLWREKGWKIIHVRHRNDTPGSVFHPEGAGFAFQEEVMPLIGETIITKTVNSSFIGTGLEEILRENGITTAVIFGLTTPHCVSTTTRMSGNLGFTTYLVSDATAAFGLEDQHGTYYDPQTIHDVSLATLHEEFAMIVTTEELISEMELEAQSV
ncbi:cysteine hydrolase family protein [Planococcus lenghuensis]|uniref:Cysteine hydrolase n=1 Tax=Planococcus lenghuensis TaxID=2213202 RepID=A0A1Q2KY78_9BACL|nr:cysteine hydrolase family protein [Planococcus lenghuensis]AQQ52612.1 cysteine hydrolase [Planococcus lenghuensis]